jgi:hypothetical protein
MIAENTKEVWIRIVAVPKGEAPEEIRRLWVDSVLPCGPICGYPPKGEKGVLSGTLSAHTRRGYVVRQERALEVLLQKSPEAFAYWNSLGFPYLDECFHFAEDEAHVAKGSVIYEQIEELTEEMLGEIDR